MYVCILDQSGAVLVHRHLKTDPETFLHVVAPYRQGMVVAVACRFTWYWLADLWADAGLPFVLGHALSMQALPGGKAKNAKSDSHQRATLLRGGRLPQAYVSPAQRRATRALLRRRMPLAHTRAELLAHGHNTNRPYTLPAIGQKIASKATREGVAERCADAAVPKSIEVDLALIPYDEALLREVALPIVHTARHHDAHPLHLWQTVPGIGKILSLVLLYEIPDVHRFPRGQDVVSSCRLVKWARESAGKRSGTSGAKLGQAHLTGAFSEAAVLFLRDHPAAQTYLARLEKKHDKGQA
jgi:transposase